MGIQPNYDGPVLVKVATPASGTLDSMGYTEDGAEVEKQAFQYNVYGDQNGGVDGPPIDVQYMGEIARIRLVFTSFDLTIKAKLDAMVAGATAGTPTVPGTLQFTESGKTFRVLLSPTNNPLNFTRCILRDAVTHNKGTKHTKYVVTFEAHKDANGVLYNATTT
jgi:hypothetical protein